MRHTRYFPVLTKPQADALVELAAPRSVAMQLAIHLYATGADPDKAASATGLELPNVMRALKGASRLYAMALRLSAHR